jgi:hypothetical protein
MVVVETLRIFYKIKMPYANVNPLHPSPMGEGWRGGQGEVA